MQTMSFTQEKLAEKILDTSEGVKFINRGWFKRQMRIGNLQHKIDAIYTDDYLYDAQSNYQKTESFEDTPVNYFHDFEMQGRHMWVSGKKDGVMRVHNHNAWYQFKLKSTVLL